MTEEQFKKGRLLLVELDNFKLYKDDLEKMIKHDQFKVSPINDSMTSILINKEDIKPIIEKEIEKTKQTIKEIEEEFKNL